MKPVLVKETAFSHVGPDQYSLERKFDGHRAILIQGKTPVLWTRERRRIEAPGHLILDLQTMGLPGGTVLDGEIWNPQKRGGWKDSGPGECCLTFWDVMRAGSRDVSRLPLEQRREVLRDMVRETESVGVAEVLPATKEAMDMVMEEARKARGTLRSGFVHGVVLKRAGSPRHDHATRSHEHSDWMKIVFSKMSGWAPR